MSESKASVSFVIPCLNEAATLAEVLSKIEQLRRGPLAERQTEVIVCDNGSTDGSDQIAQQQGATVVHCAKRGYGAALKAGIERASGQVVVFADADNTYDWLETPGLIDELEKGHDLVVGSRLDGKIWPGAMPFLHRYVGTPVLNFFLNLLYARGKGRIRDCNSGFRCFRRESFLSWGVRSDGMEFASEMLVKALKAEARISHVPVSLYPDRKGRAPHLQRWRDGMRHLLQIFIDCPGFFFVCGMATFVLSWAVILTGLLVGPIRVGFMWIFGMHSMMFGLLGTVFAIILWGIGLFLSVRVETSVRMYRYLVALSEDRLFWYSVAATAVSAAMFGAIVIYWAASGFHFIQIERLTLGAVAFGSNGILLVWHVVTAHLLKRA